MKDNKNQLNTNNKCINNNNNFKNIYSGSFKGDFNNEN